MKKSLIFWLAVSVCTAWILVGCEQEPETNTVYDKSGAIYGSATGAQLQAYIDTAAAEGRSLTLDGVTVLSGTVDLKTVSVKIVGTLTLGANVILNARTAAVVFDTGAAIAGQTSSVIIGTAAKFPADNLDANIKLAAPAANDVLPGTAAEVGGVTAVENLTLGAVATSIPTGLTVYVYGNLTVNAGSVQPTQGKVVAIGTVTLAANNAVALSNATYVDVSAAEITVSGEGSNARTVTLPDTISTRFYLSGQQDKLTVTGGTTSFTAYVRGNGLLELASVVTAVAITGSGNVEFDGALTALQGSIEAAKVKFTSTVTTASATLGFSNLSATSGTVEFANTAVFTIGATFANTGLTTFANTVTSTATGTSFAGDVVFKGNVTVTAGGLEFGGAAYFADEAVVTLSAESSVVTLKDGAAFVAGEPGANPWVYDAVLQAVGGDAILTPGATVTLTFATGAERGIEQGATTAALVLSGDAHITSGATYTVAAGSSAANILKVAAESVLTLGSGALEGQGAEFNTAVASIVLTGHASHAGSLVLANKTEGTAGVGGGGKLVLVGGGTAIGTTGAIQPAQTVTLANLTATGPTDGTAAFTFAGSSGDLSSITSISTSPQGFKSIEAGTVSDTATTGTVTFKGGASGTAKLDKAATLQSGS